MASSPSRLQEQLTSKDRELAALAAQIEELKERPRISPLSSPSTIDVVDDAASPRKPLADSTRVNQPNRKDHRIDEETSKHLPKDLPSREEMYEDLLILKSALKGMLNTPQPSTSGGNIDVRKSATSVPSIGEIHTAPLITPF